MLCPSFHGATVLSVVLGNHSRVLSMGDTIPLARPGYCGCGKLRSDCAFWSRLSEAWGPSAGPTLIPASPVILPWEGLNQAACIGLSTLAARLNFPLEIEPFRRAFDCYLSVCRDMFEFDIFIDGYKSLSRYAALKAADYPVRGVIHLTRDPRSFVASAKRRGRCPTLSAKRWASTHSRITRITNWMRERTIIVRHENLCANPEAELARVQGWLGVEVEQLLVQPGPDRHWIGNQTVRHFDGRIRPQRPWQGDLTNEERSKVETITARQAIKLGYTFS